MTKRTISTHTDSDADDAPQTTRPRTRNATRKIVVDSDDEDAVSGSDVQMESPKPRPKKKVKKTYDKITKPAAGAVINSVAHLVLQLEKSKLTQSRLALRTAELEEKNLATQLAVETLHATNIESKKIADLEVHAAAVAAEEAKQATMAVQAANARRKENAGFSAYTSISSAFAPPPIAPPPSTSIFGAPQATSPFGASQNNRGPAFGLRP
ncbi:hypothetical protein C8J57DRAFT_498226 [Mycena rebaudengoi]|nr:hypothetical protein C8J57DRAFT_498226 [Mycena rebaudengoi]